MLLTSLLHWWYSSCLYTELMCCDASGLLLLLSAQKFAKKCKRFVKSLVTIFFAKKLQFDDAKMHYLYHHNILLSFFLGVKPLVLKTIYFIKYFSPFKSTVLLHSCYITFHYGCKDCVLHIFVWNQSRNSTLGYRKYTQSGFLLLKNIQYLNQDAKIL